MMSQNKVVYDGTNFDSWILYVKFVLQPYLGYLDGTAAQILIDERVEKNKEVRRNIRQQFYMLPNAEESRLERMLDEAELDDRMELTPSESRKWNEGNRKAISALAQTLSIDFQGLIASSETYYDAWTTIIESHKGGDRYAVIYHIRDLIELKLNDSKDLIMYVRNKADAARRVKSMGINQLSSEAIDFLHASALTLGLPESMMSVRRKLEDLCKNERDFSPEAVAKILIDENARYHLSSFGKASLSGNVHFRDDSAMMLNENSKRKFTKKYKSISCALCGRSNHEKAKCFWNPQYEEYGSKFASWYRKNNSRFKPSDMKYAELGIPVESVLLVQEEPEIEDDDEQKFEFAYVATDQSAAWGSSCEDFDMPVADFSHQEVVWGSSNSCVKIGAVRDHESAWNASNDGIGTSDGVEPVETSERVEELYVSGVMSPEMKGAEEDLSKLFY